MRELDISCKHCSAPYMQTADLLCSYCGNDPTLDVKSAVGEQYLKAREALRAIEGVRVSGSAPRDLWGSDAVADIARELNGGTVFIELEARCAASVRRGYNELKRS